MAAARPDYDGCVSWGIARLRQKRQDRRDRCEVRNRRSSLKATFYHIHGHGLILDRDMAHTYAKWESGLVDPGDITATGIRDNPGSRRGYGQLAVIVGGEIDGRSPIVVSVDDELRGNRLRGKGPVEAGTT